MESPSTPQQVNPDGTVSIQIDPIDAPPEPRPRRHALFAVRSRIHPNGDADSTVALIGEGCEFSNGICHVEWYLPQGSPPLSLNSVWWKFAALSAAIATYGFEVVDL